MSAVRSHMASRYWLTEKGWRATERLAGVNAGQGDHFPARGAEDAPDEAKGATASHFRVAAPAPATPVNKQPCPQCTHWASNHTREGGCGVCEHQGRPRICGWSRGAIEAGER